MKKKIINDRLDNRPRGTIRSKLVVLIDCPKCHSKLKLIERIRDDNTVKGELLLYEED